MKRSFILSCLFLVALVFGSSQVLAQISYPAPRGHVNDFANVIPDDIEQRMELRLRDYEQKTTNEIAVVTVTSLEGLSIEDYTVGLAQKWGVGKKGKDNGVVLLVAPKEREVRIEVGYGLESVLTDAQSVQIIAAMTPYLKENKYGPGIDFGVQKITDVIGYLTPVERFAQQKEQEERNRAAVATFFTVLMWIVIAVVLIVAGIFARKKALAWNEERQRKELVRQQALENIKVVEDRLNKVTADIKKLVGGGS